MRAALVHLLILAAILWGGLAVPAVAHGHGGSLGEHADTHATTEADHHVEAPSGDPQDDGRDDGVAPHHHHCPAGLTALAPAMTDRLSPRCDTLHPAPTARLFSRALAPLTEPPAA